jgi:hypothetical protein
MNAASKTKQTKAQYDDHNNTDDDASDIGTHSHKRQKPAAASSKSAIGSNRIDYLMFDHTFYSAKA